ncbi:MAG: cell division protein FtsZ [Chloroflexota bacterium]|nr:cell division protein FtsZ [Chloroflexota bacterium]
MELLLGNRLVQLAVLAALLAVAVRLGLHIWGLRAVERRIRVVGVGGGGSNAVDALIGAGIKGTDYIAINTDAQALRRSRAPKKIQIGKAMTDGLGAGGDPLVGEAAAHEAAVEIGRAVAGSDLVVVTAGLGGGTGSGAAPVVAAIAREHGVLTVAVTTKPFSFEGPRRHAVAEAAAAELRTKVDALLTVPNDRVRDIVPADASVEEAFRTVDEVLRRSVQEILDIIGTAGRINLDFADVRSVIKGGGSAVMGVGRASGPNRAVEAARQSMAGSMQEGRMNGATSILLNVTGSHSLTLAELTAAAEEVRAHAHPEANLVFGTMIDRKLGKDIQVTLIATGFGSGGVQRHVLEKPADFDVVSPPLPAGRPADWVPPWRRDRQARPPLEADGLETPIPAYTAPDFMPTASAASVVAPDSARVGAERRRRKRGVEVEGPIPVSVSSVPTHPTAPDPKAPRFLRRR